ncbi:hypothetical protein [Frigoriglobus tundricola]|uniref:2-oxoacid dehydrogenase acyltransferase catalytic domain-containing protein n=1 Tax=Frigoriglobus tundricola TaxID=2774151 RepID=A0A6M5YZU1_9BACT|nr:hypothetical protein [Frigoriglobus tundricola]QJW99579.1 hypothetical protein FTUN_7191 [Frigoriglobus tundricola]
MSTTGHRLGLSVPRRFVCDLLRAAQRVPIVTFERRMELAAVVAARRTVARPPAWVLLFAKAFAAVAARRPEFRRTYLSRPWPHLWEADESVASIAIEREFEGESAVFFGFVKAPDKRPLAEMTAVLEEWKTRPVEEVRPFCRQVHYTRYPWPLRRFFWWIGTEWSGKKKAQNFGTFGLSLTGSAGATALNLIGPLTVALNTGVVRDDGTVDVRMHFDHRVLDGMPVARALAEMETYLRTDIVAELTTPARSVAA